MSQDTTTTATTSPEGETTQVENGVKKEGHTRSASYPNLLISEALAFTSDIYKHFGMGVSVSRENIAIKLGKHPGSITRDVAACSQFGFLTKDSKDTGYRVSEAYKNYTQPTSEKEKKLILLNAFNTPKLYQELIVKFDGSIIPTELANTLKRFHGISENAADSAAKLFIENGQFVEAINDSNVLRYKDMVSTISKSNYAEIIEETKTSPDEKPLGGVPKILDGNEFTQLPSDRKIPIYLTKGKIAFLLYPSDISKKDVKLLDHGVKGILLNIELEEDELEDTKKGAEAP